MVLLPVIERIQISSDIVSHPGIFRPVFLLIRGILWNHDAAVFVRNRLRELRETNGWLQQELANRIGVSRQTIIAIEKGKYDPSLPLAFSIARVFGSRIEDIFFPDDGD
jgi:putative transcriptional regulator